MKRRDPIIEELHRVCEDIGKAHDFDLRRIAAAIRQRPHSRRQAARLESHGRASAVIGIVVSVLASAGCGGPSTGPMRPMDGSREATMQVTKWARNPVTQVVMCRSDLESFSTRDAGMKGLFRVDEGGVGFAAALRTPLLTRRPE
jgi:hypothetical protein